MEKVCLVLVTYNRYAILQKTLEEVFNQTRLPDHVIVIDNFSTDGTFHKLKNDARYQVIQTNDNVGYGAAAAVGMRCALSQFPDLKYFWIMDDDSRPSAKALETLLAGYRSSKISRLGILGLVGFKLKFGGYKPIHKTDNGNLNRVAENQHIVPADFVLMDGSLVSVEMVNACGVYVEDYFMIGEDYEYCKRALHHGFGVALMLSDDAVMDRLVLGGGGKFSRPNIWRGYYQARNHVDILRKYFTPKDALGYFFRQSKFLIASLMAKDRFERIYFRLLGMVHGFRGISGKTIKPFN
jgi:rhamnopyranosyl-N-acetylglucosaminyl-diphospho-decaprenol beta-1,3/1,4-galactofuranosyltransferase